VSTFAKKLLEQISSADSAKMLKVYLAKRSGRHFETFQVSENKPNEITASDLLAVSQLSMKIGGYSKRDSISETAVIALFDGKIQVKLSKYLAIINPSWRLENVSSKDLETFNRAINKLWPILRDDVGLKKVATFKLLARKRPHMCPIRDSFAEQALGNPKDWYWSWQEAFKQESNIVAKLEKLRDGHSGAKHLSLLRVADIIIWERQATK
jgi:hypothetical protein